MKFKNVFKSLFVGYLIVGLLVSIPFTILTMTGKIPVVINNKEHYGLIGLTVPLLYVPMCSAICALLNTAILLLGAKFVNRTPKEN